MKFSKNLLTKFVTIPTEIDTDRLMDDLTLKSFEIEGVKSRKLPDLLVIGKCTSVSKHPEADKLNVCQVDCGGHGVFQILTGGENIAEGKFVPTAIPGCFLPHINLQIDPRKMRGMDSNGMICSKGEIGINEDEEYHWIWLLDEDFDDLTDTDIGKSLGEKYPRLADEIFEVKNIAIANRSDLTGHIGLSYDVAAIYDTEIVDMSSMYVKPENIANLENITINNQAGELLRNYHAIYISNVKSQKSSFMTRTMCRDFECTPHDGRVDYGNIFMNISGQPIHFFDADKISSNIYISLATEGEEFEDLFGTKHILNSRDLVIRDDVKTIALAGVMGGLNSAVDENTKNILAEIANFDPVSIRKTATRLNLRSDASGRYEKNINPLWTVKCANMLANELIMYKEYYTKDMGDYNIVGLTNYSNETLIGNFEHNFDIYTGVVNNFIFGNGDIIVDSDQIANILKKLGFDANVDVDNNNHIYVSSPVHRNDISNYQDIYEEIARIYGYSNIPNTQFTATITSSNQPNIYTTNRKSEDFWLSNKYSQVETYLWISDEDVVRYGFGDIKLVKMLNAMDPSNKQLRPAIYPSLIQNIANNFRFFDEINIFDIAKTYIYKDCTHNDSNNIFSNIAGIAEHFGIAIAKYNAKGSGDMKSDNTLSIKNQVRKYISDLGINGDLRFEKTANSRFHPNKQATIYIGETPVGYMGSLHPMILEQYKLSADADLAVAELNLSVLCDLLGGEWVQPVYYNQQSQLVDRDLSFVMPADFDYGKVLDIVRSVPNVVDTKVFDIYKLNDGTKSIGIKIYILGDGTWSTDQINAVSTNCVTEVEKLNDVKLRG